MLGTNANAAESENRVDKKNISILHTCFRVLVDMLGQAKLRKGTREVDARATQSRFQAKTKPEQHYEQGSMCRGHLSYTWFLARWWCPALLAGGR